MKVESRAMYKFVCKVLGSDFEEKAKRGEHLHKELYAPVMMPLSVEAWKEGEEVMISVTHYGEQNGDAMRDPEVLFRVFPVFDRKKLCWVNSLQPVSYENDYFSAYDEAVKIENGEVKYNIQVLNDLVRFVNTWARDLKKEVRK